MSRKSTFERSACDTYECTHIYASTNHEGMQYKIIFGHPTHMLEDENISWEAKGYLSYIAFLPSDMDLPDHIVDELIEYGYLVEVVK